MIDRLKADDLMGGMDTLSPEDAKAIRDYFAQFLPLDGEKRVVCGNGHVHRGGFSSFLGGPLFKWAIAHGEGYCTGGYDPVKDVQTKCGWPMRAHHYVKGADGVDIISLKHVPLAVHPDLIASRAAEIAATIAEEAKA